MNTKNYIPNTAAKGGLRHPFTYLTDFHWAVMRDYDCAWDGVAVLRMEPAQQDGTREYDIVFSGQEENPKNFAFEANDLAEHLARGSARWNDVYVGIDFLNNRYEVGSWKQGWEQIPFEAFYDEHGYDADGYDDQGYNEEGYDRNGEDREGSPAPRDEDYHVYFNH